MSYFTFWIKSASYVFYSVRDEVQAQRLWQDGDKRRLTSYEAQPFSSNVWKHPGRRAVTEISSCYVNTTSARGIKQLGISFGSIFLLFSYGSSRGLYSWKIIIHIHTCSDLLCKILYPRISYFTILWYLIMLRTQHIWGSFQNLGPVSRSHIYKNAASTDKDNRLFPTTDLFNRKVSL